MSIDRSPACDDLAIEPTAAARRRGSILLLSLLIVSSILMACTAVPAIRQVRTHPGSIGVPASAAGCAPVVDDGVYPSPHVGPGTSTPTTTRVTYRTAPPTSGPHFQVPSPMSRRYYTTQDRPPMEQLVHNLEHGYLIIWYDPSAPPKQLEQLRDLTRGGPRQSRHKYIVAPWDQTYGTLSDHLLALAVWGHHQLCDRPSGEAIAQFRAKFPIEDAPEPAGN